MATTTRTRTTKPPAPRKSRTKPTAPKPAVTITAPARLPKGCKPSNTLSKDLTRPVLTHGYIRKDRKRGWELLLTDSYQLARIPLVTDRPDATPDVTEGFLSVEAIKEMDRGKTITTTKQAMRIDGGYERPRLNDRGHNAMTFPQHFESMYPVHARPLRLGLNAELLHKLAKTLGSETVSIEIDLDQLAKLSVTHTYLKPFVVRPLIQGNKKTEQHNGDGLLMPVKIS